MPAGDIINNNGRTAWIIAGLTLISLLFFAIFGSMAITSSATDEVRDSMKLERQERIADVAQLDVSLQRELNDLERILGGEINRMDEKLQIEIAGIEQTLQVQIINTDAKAELLAKTAEDKATLLAGSTTATLLALTGILEKLRETLAALEAKVAVVEAR